MGPGQITDRDHRMLAFAAGHRFIFAAQIGMLLGISAPAAHARLNALRDTGHLTEGDVLKSEPSHYQVTTRGLGAISSDLPRPRTVDLSLYRHDAGLAWLSVAAERGMFGPLRQIVPERQMRSQDGRAGADGWIFGVRVGAVGRGGRPRLHYPDLTVVTESGHRVAFELELTLKEPRRREKILAAYAGERRIDAVIYLVDHPARRRAMRDSVRRVGVADRVRVEQVKFGHRPGAPTTGSRIVQRTTRRGAHAGGAGR